MDQPIFLNSQSCFGIHLGIYLSVVSGWADDPIASFWN